MQDFEDMTDGQVNARRNYFMGLWAGRVLGLQSNELNQYVSSVMAADFEEPGPFDVVRKIKKDFDKSGRSWDERRLLEQLKSFERKARSELCVTD